MEMGQEENNYCLNVSLTLADFLDNTPVPTFDWALDVLITNIQEGSTIAKQKSPYILVD